MRQSALCVPVLWPRIAEIQIKARQLAFLEAIRNRSEVHICKYKILSDCIHTVIRISRPQALVKVSRCRSCLLIVYCESVCRELARSLLKRSEHNAPVALYCEEIALRVRLCERKYELPLSASELHIKRLLFRKHFLPAALQRLRVYLYAPVELCELFIEVF